MLLKTTLRTAVVASALALPALAFAQTKPMCPNMQIILDRSGSMAGSKWSSAVTAITNGSTGVVYQYGTEFHWGLQMFANDGYCGVGAPEVSINTNLLTPSVANATATSITNAINAATPNSNTPTGEAVDWFNANNYAPFNDSLRAPYVMLITDGAPNCTDAGDGSYTVGRIQALRAKFPKLKLFAVGFGTGVDPNIMNMIAIAGGEPMSAPPAGCTASSAPQATCGTLYYQADPSSLAQAMATIIQKASGELGGGGCDESCFGQGCPSGQVCKSVSGTPTCVTDPCASKQCGTDEFCRVDASGTAQCVGACTSLCPGTQVCKDGQCVNDACLGQSCSSTQICVMDANGTPSCITPSCTGSCPDPWQSCVNGQCVDNPCANVSCPSGTACSTNDTGNQAQCLGSKSPPGGDGGGGGGGGGGSDGGTGTKGGGTGCGCGGPAAFASLAWLALAGFSRRRRH